MPIVAAPSTPCPIVAIPVTTNQVYAQQAPPVTSVAATPPQNKTCDSSVLSTPSPPSNDVSSTDSHAKDGQSSFRLSPPPNLSSILDISLPSADAPEDTSIGGESLIAMAMDTAGLTGIDQPLTSEPSETSTPGKHVQNSQQENREAGTSTPPPSTVSPTSSPFKQLTSDSHWLNGETMDLSSLSGFLNGIESPEKRDKAVPTLNSICPLPVMYCESSRDSIMSTSNFQVEGTLQSLMNENSIDYIAKFADLAAHIEESIDLPGNLGVNETVAMEPAKDGVPKALDFSSVDFGSGKLNNGLKSVS
ncbi:protein cramped-like [Anneissia japonica]|uniref:protein cramped-like n=1 Tax=Anneissia japonica TaxID=1529436 RepID=UPI0014255F49|nr:protein cramped-like [Anneissia japonica]